MRIKKTLAALALGFGATAASWACLGAQEPADRPRTDRQGLGEQVGEAIDRAARVASRRARKLSADVEAAYRRARTEISNFGVEARITGRLVWDRDLQGAQIELDVNDEGVAVLHGAVPSAAARSKAVALTRDTIGVSQVVDELKVVEPPRPEPVDRPKPE